MPIETSYSNLRQELASYLDRVTDDREVVIVRRKGKEDVALIAASELAGLDETAYLLRSPANAARLLAALKRAERGNGRIMTVDEIRKEYGLEKA